MVIRARLCKQGCVTLGRSTNLSEAGLSIRKTAGSPRGPRDKLLCSLFRPSMVGAATTVTAGTWGHHRSGQGSKDAKDLESAGPWLKSRERGGQDTAPVLPHLTSPQRWQRALGEASPAQETAPPPTILSPPLWPPPHVASPPGLSHLSSVVSHPHQTVSLEGQPGSCPCQARRGGCPADTAGRWWHLGLLPDSAL